MPMDPEDIKILIETAIPDANVTLEDLVGDRDHWSAHVVSKSFEGKTRVQQHQLVYKALGGHLGEELHALALHTSVPDL